jgi:hypothetical protein
MTAAARWVNPLTGSRNFSLIFVFHQLPFIEWFNFTR